MGWTSLLIEKTYSSYEHSRIRELGFKESLVQTSLSPQDLRVGVTVPPQYLFILRTPTYKREVLMV